MVLVLKTNFGGDLRRIPLHNDFLTFDELHLMLCRVYESDIGDDDKLMYKDLDSDWITIADSNDLQLAIQTIQEANQKTLWLKVGSPSELGNDEVIKDLRAIRDMSIGLIDRIGDGSSGKKKVEIAKVSPTPVSAPVEIKLEPVAEPVAPEPVAPEPVAELLQSEEMQAFDPIQTERAESIASVSTSASIPVQSVQPVMMPPSEPKYIEPIQPEPVVSQYQAPPVTQPTPPPVAQPTPVLPVNDMSSHFSQAPTAGNYFNSNLSVHSGDGLSSNQASAPPTPTPVLPPSMQQQNPVQQPIQQNQQPPQIVKQPEPVVPQPTNLHGQSSTSQYFQQQYQQPAYSQQQQQYAAAYQQQAIQQQQAPVSQPTPQQQNQPPAPTGYPQQQQTQQPATGYPQQQQQATNQQQHELQQQAYAQQYAQQYGNQYQQPPQAQAAAGQGPPSNAPPPQAMPTGGYRLNRNARHARPGYQ